MSGITKIQSIENIGIFENFLWPAELNNYEFKKVNIIYGYNGSGKTTLSQIMHLFSEDLSKEEKESLLNYLKTNQKKDIKINIEWDSENLKSFNNSKKVYVFNTNFISNHVYNGTNSNIRFFKDSVITDEQLSNPEIKNLTFQITSKEKYKEIISNKKKSLIKICESIKDELSKRWNDVIQGSRMPSNLNLESIPEYAPSETEENLDNNINESFRRYKLSKDQESLKDDISKLSSISITLLPNIKDFFSLLQVNVSSKARERVKLKIEQSKAVTLNHLSHQNWFEDGFNFLKSGHFGNKCPLCESDINNIEAILLSYQNYFSDELSNFKKNIDSTCSDLKRALEYIEQHHSIINLANNLIRKYDSSKILKNEFKDAIEFILNSDLNTVIKSALELLESKKANIELVVKDEDVLKFSNFLEYFKSYNSQLLFIGDLCQNLLDDLRQNSFDLNKSKELFKNLFWVRVNNQITSNLNELKSDLEEELLALTNGLEFTKFLLKREAEIPNEITKLTLLRSEKLSEFKKESKYINLFLPKLCVSNFTVDINNGDGGIRILYKNDIQKNGINHSLSEGEKTALAFAYFLSKYKYEVIDNKNNSQKDCVIILDDPVSSLDENRLYSTALIIKDIFNPIENNENKTDVSACKQLFLLSHNLIFLKFLGSIFNNKSEDRRDYYLEKGCLIKLPKKLNNFYTSYFYKLEKIKFFCENKEKYEDIKDSLPNSIRTVLETFLSFKFCRLKGNQYPSPSLQDLISHLSGYNFNKHQAVGNIKDKETLKEALNFVNKVVNSESHGTPQDITHLEYLSEQELLNVAQLSLDIIAFLDQIHYQKSTEN